MASDGQGDRIGDDEPKTDDIHALADTDETRRGQLVGDDDMPDDIREAKAKLEAKTGKKYLYRPPKKDLPSIQDLILQDALKEKSFLDIIKFPALVFMLFLISMQLFIKFVPDRGERKYELPQVKRSAAMQQRMVQMQHHAADLVSEPAVVEPKAGDIPKPSVADNEPLIGPDVAEVEVEVGDENTKDRLGDEL
jgi:hypothetical protein